MRGHILNRISQSRGFFFALLAVAIIWVLTAMAEQKRFRETYPVSYDNIDTALFAIIHKDSAIVVDISSNGFHAFGRGKDKNKSIHIDIASFIKQHENDSLFSITMRIEEYMDLIKAQLDMRGVSEVNPVNEQLNLQIAVREQKAFVPDISHVTFNFDKMTGLAGKPVIIPDTVYLYGSRESLSKIDMISAKTQSINNINKSKKHKISLREDWKKYPDLRISNEELEIYIPVEKYVEKSITLPIVLTDKNDNAQWNLYPANVTVQLLVPESKVESVDLSKCVVTASAQECSGNHIIPQLTKFPSSVRLKSISPDKVQYIIIEE